MYIYLYDTNQPQKAVKVFQRYVQAYPEADDAWVAVYDIAICYENMGDKQKAIEILQKAFEKYKYTEYAMSIIQKLIQLQNQP